MEIDYVNIQIEIKKLIMELRFELRKINIEYDKTGSLYCKGYMGAYAGIIRKLEKIYENG